MITIVVSMLLKIWLPYCTHGHGPRSLSENRHSRNKRTVHPGLDTNRYLHGQLVNIICSTPEDHTIKTSNKKPGVATR